MGHDLTPYPPYLPCQGGKAAARSRCITLYGASRVVVEGVHLAGCFRAILLSYPVLPAVRARDVVVRNCSFADIRCPYGAYQPTRTPWGTAVDVVAGFVGVALQNLTLVNNVAIRLDVFATVSQAVDGFLFSGNTATRCGGNCVQLGASNMHLEDSVFLRVRPSTLSLQSDCWTAARSAFAATSHRKLIGSSVTACSSRTPSLPPF